MKKFIVFAVVLAFLVPAAAFAKADFSLGGYIKMAVIWDSTQVNKNLLAFNARKNSLTYNHGRLKFTAENTRMSFTIKGPNLWGAKTMAYIEWDFDNHANEYLSINTGGGWASPHKARIGLRHAFFRFNWPETELLMGSYWSILTEEVPETVNFGACTMSGQPFLREPQIRLTQTFGLGGGKLFASFALAQPTNGLWGLAINGNQQNVVGNPYGGESSETPKLEGRLKYDVDLWGKAAFWGNPRPFSVRVGAAWWRERFRALDNFNLPTMTEFGYTNIANCFTKQEYISKFLVEGSIFVPILATHTKNLAGTASLLTQWFFGQGMDGYFEDLPNNATFMKVNFQDGINRYCDREALKRYGGFVQLQYYFTNQWYANAVWGLNRAFDVNRTTWLGDGAADPWRSNQHYYLSLWYRPIQAVKFGLEYTYVRTDYFMKLRNQGQAVALGGGGFKAEDIGENHRVIFAGYYFF